MSEPNPNITGSPAPTPDKPEVAVTATPAAAAPPKPAPAAALPKPAAKPAAKGGRRFFLFGLFFGLFGSWIAVAWTSFTATMAAMTLGTLSFLYPKVLTEPPNKFKVGFPDGFEEGKVIDRFKDQKTWIVRYGGQIYALSTTCTHLGCTPNWLEREQKFKCPCHGSGFYITGINFEGPAPRPLERWAISLGDDGQVVVDESKKFQYERGEWSNPESYIKV